MSGEPTLPFRAAEPIDNSALAAEIKRSVPARARELFASLVARHQRRAYRLAYSYLRNHADTDEAVQDAFVRVYTHMSSYREELPFEVWFTRILVNLCLDRLKNRARRERWLVPGGDPLSEPDVVLPAPGRGSPTPEELLMRREFRGRVARAVSHLPKRQRDVFMLCHYDHRSFREVGAITGLRESTVRVHLFRAIRKLRRALEAGGRL